MTTANRLTEFLSAIPIAAARLTFDLEPSRLNVPRMRGVWGAALHALDRDAYSIVYKPGESGGTGPDEVPGYVVRPGPPRSDAVRVLPSLDLILIGAGVEWFEVALRAWDMAAGMGLGADRAPFPIVARESLSPAGFPDRWGRAWTLDTVFDYVGAGDDSLPLELRLATPLSLHRQGRLIEQPSLVDLLGKTCRRIECFLPSNMRRPWYEWRGELIEDARRRACTGRFDQPRRLHRYSARQDRDLYIPGVVGSLWLPDGAGPLLPILMALTWLHVGKGANLGLGQVTLQFDESVRRG